MHKVNLSAGRMEIYDSTSKALINGKVAAKYPHSSNKSKNIPAVGPVRQPYAIVDLILQ
jgi:hypothetical protein